MNVLTRALLAVDRLYFNDDGTIRPVVMTNDGVAARPVP